jgi:hypothetical protein
MVYYLEGDRLLDLLRVRNVEGFCYLFLDDEAVEG